MIWVLVASFFLACLLNIKESVSFCIIAFTIAYLLGFKLW